MRKAKKQTKKTQSIPRRLFRVCLVLLALAGCWFAMHCLLLFIFDWINGTTRENTAEAVFHAAMTAEQIPGGSSIGGVTELVSGNSIIRRETEILPHQPKQSLAMHIKLWQSKGGKVLDKQNFELKRNLPYRHELLIMPDKSVVFLKAEPAPEGTKLTVIQCSATTQNLSGETPLDRTALESCPADAAKLCIGQPLFIMTRGTGQLKTWTFHAESELSISAVRLDIQQKCSQQNWVPHTEMSETLQAIRNGDLDLGQEGNAPDIMMYRKGNYQCTISMTKNGTGTNIHYRVSEINKQIWNTKQGETPHE